MKRKYCAILMFCAMFAACETTGNENSTANRNAAAPTANETGRKAADEANSKAGGNSNSPGNSAESPDFMGTAGITEKKYEIKNAAILEDVRAGRHEGFDRVVFEFEDAEMPSYHVEYIDAPVRACGSGNVVSLKGDGFLEIRFTPANAHTEDGEPTVKNREQWPNLKIIKEIKSTCDFEAEVEWVLGVAAANKYRVLELKNPTRLAIDIKH